MATLTFSQNYDMRTTQLFEGDIISQDSSHITISDGVHTETSYGKFSYDENGDIASAKYTGSTTYLNGTLQYTYTGLKVTPDGLNAASSDPLVLQGYLLAGADKIYGAAGHDYLLGYNGNDAVYGYAGDDTIFGGEGNDKLYGGTGNDALHGENGNDALYGEEGNDTLYGDAGNNKLYGGVGNDTYIVASVADKITEKAGEGNDTVESSVSYVLGKNIETLVLSGSTAINGEGNDDANTLLGNASRNILLGAAGNDNINGGGGLDDLFGGAGNDTLTGGAGTDKFVFDTLKNAGIDTITDMLAGGESDKIQLDDDAFKGLTKVATNGVGIRSLTNTEFYLGTAAHDADDRIIYNQSTGALYYDQDGTGTKFAAVQIAMVGVSTHPTLTYTDFQVIA